MFYNQRRRTSTNSSSVVNLFTFKLSSRDLVAMMAERGIGLAHTTILRWIQRYAPEFEKRWSRYARPVSGVMALRRDI